MMDATALIMERFQVVDDPGPLPLRAQAGDRTALAQLFAELGFNAGAEIGVNMGRFSKHLLAANPNLHMRLVDPWPTRGKYRNAIERLARYGERAEFIRQYSVDAVKDVEDESLDFVYIDALHDYDSAMMDIISWTPKVRRGGIVSGHDYMQYERIGVIAAVNAYTQAHRIDPWFITWEVVTPSSHSWFWVR